MPTRSAPSIQAWVSSRNTTRAGLDIQFVSGPQVGLGVWLGEPVGAGVDEGVELLELGDAGEEVGAVDADAVVGEHADLVTGGAGIGHQRVRIRVTEAVGEVGTELAEQVAPVGEPVALGVLLPVLEERDLAPLVLQPEVVIGIVWAAADQLADR